METFKRVKTERGLTYNHADKLRASRLEILQKEKREEKSYKLKVVRRPNGSYDFIEYMK